jgi:hypothetical protein
MKKLAARNYEDLLQVSILHTGGRPISLHIKNLQCAIPVFEHLLPYPHNDIVCTLLFELATWHGLAKLRLHTDTTLGFLESSTVRLGKNLRQFEATTCNSFDTVELPHEETARRRRQAAKDPKRKGEDMEDGRKCKKFNLSTYKLHALGDYVNTIRQYGTTDNYSTQVVRIKFTTRIHTY